MVTIPTTTTVQRIHCLKRRCTRTSMGQQRTSQPLRRRLRGALKITIVLLRHTNLTLPRDTTLSILPLTMVVMYQQQRMAKHTLTRPKWRMAAKRLLSTRTVLSRCTALTLPWITRGTIDTTGVMDTPFDCGLIYFHRRCSFIFPRGPVFLSFQSCRAYLPY